jgi:hypothetical protein
MTNESILTHPLLLMYQSQKGIGREGGYQIFDDFKCSISNDYEKNQWCFTEKSTTKAPAKHHKITNLAP